MRVQTPHNLALTTPQSLSQVAATDLFALDLLRRTAIYPIAGRYLPETHLGIHDLYLGQIGCGKTLEMLQKCWRVMQPVEYQGETLLRHRSVFLDGKGNDILHNFEAWIPEGLLAIVCPFHPRGVRWAVGKDCMTFEAGEQLGYTVMPITEKSHMFFNAAAMQLSHGVIQAFQLHGDDWFLSDIVVACCDEKLLRHVLGHHPRGQEILGSYLPDRIDTSANILQTMRVELSPWRTVALLEGKATESISLKDWMKSGGVLGLLGSALDPDIIDRYNALIFKYAVRNIRARQDDLPLDHSYLFVDEMPKPVLDDYVDALLQGRSKGLRSSATIQDPASLITRLGSREHANEILGQVGNLWTGRITGPDAAEWLAKFFGKYEYWVTKPGWSSDGKRTTHSEHKDIRETYNVYPYDYQGFPMASLDGGYTAVAMTPAVRGWRTHVPGEFIKLNLGPPPNKSGFTPRALDREDIAYTLGPADFNRLGLRQFGEPKPTGTPGRTNRKQGGFRLP